MEKDLEISRSKETEESQSDFGLGVDLEKEDSTTSSLTDPEAVYISTHGQTVSRHTTHHTHHSGHSAHRVVTAQDWTGPDDPENPHNWPAWKRYWHSIPPGLFGLSV